MWCFHFSFWRLKPQRGTLKHDQREAERWRPCSEGGAPACSGHHYFLQWKNPVKASKRLWANLQTRKANIAPHFKVSNKLLYRFPFNSRYSIWKLEEKKKRPSFILHNSSSYELLSATQWTCHERAWRGCLMCGTETSKETYGKCSAAWLCEDHRAMNNGKIEWGGGGGACKTSNPEGQPSWSFRSLQKKKKWDFFILIFPPLEGEEGDPSAIHGEIPTNWTSHLSDQSVCVCNGVTPMNRAAHTWRRRQAQRWGGMQALKLAWKKDSVVLQHKQADKPNTVCFNGNNTHAYRLFTPAAAGCNQKQVCVSAVFF